MLTITPAMTSPPTRALVVVDPCDGGVVHAHGGCADLSALVDLVERTSGVPVECPDAFDSALVDLGLAIGLDAATGLAPCTTCWGS